MKHGVHQKTVHSQARGSKAIDNFNLLSCWPTLWD